MANKPVVNDDGAQDSGAEPGTERAPEEPRRSPARRTARAMFHPELGLSLAPMRESAGAFAMVLSAAWAWASHPRRERRRRTRLGVTGWVVLILAVSAVVYGAAVVLGGLLLVAVPQAHGQVVDPGILGGSDPRTRELLDFVYGIGRADGVGLGEMLRYFSAAVLVVVGVVLLYQVLFAVVETGRTGEGRLTGWQVIRLVIGVGLIFPLPATGLGPGQHIFLGMIDVGGNIASGVWSRVSTLLVGGGSTGPVQVPESHKDVVGKMLLIQTCMYLHNEIAAAAGHGAYIKVVREVTDEAVEYRYEDEWEQYRYRPCGSVVVSRLRSTENPGAMIVADAHYEAVSNPRFQAALRAAARELGDVFLPNKPTSGQLLPEVDEWLARTELAAMYARVLQIQVGRAGEASRATLDESLREALEQEGWLAAASYFTVISRNQAQFYDALAAVPEVSVGGDWWGSVLGRTVDVWQTAGPALEEWLARSSEVGPSGRVTSSRANTVSSLFDLLDFFPLDLAIRIDDARPLESMVGMGHTMLNAGLTVIVGGGLGSVLTSAAWVPGRIAALAGKGMNIAGGAAARIGATGEGIWKVVYLAAWALVIGGVVLAYVVPLIPFLRFVFGVVSWVISVVEGLVAVPLFLALQIGEDTKGLVSQASRGGYLLVLHAVIRPALMVLGLVFGFFIFMAMIGLFNWMFEAHLEGSGTASTMGAITLLISLVVYTVVAFGIANASFKAIEVVPGEVMRWLGGHARGGSEGGGLGQFLSRKVMSTKAPVRGIQGGR